MGWRSAINPARFIIVGLAGCLMLLPDKHPPLTYD